MWEGKNRKLLVVDEPGADQSSPLETYVVPDNNVPGLLCVIYLVWWNEDVVECVQECNDGMVMEDAVVVDGSTQSNIPSLLPIPSYSHSSASLITSHFNAAIHCSPNQEPTCGPYIAKAVIASCKTALEMEVLPFEKQCVLSEHKEVLALMKYAK